MTVYVVTTKTRPSADRGVFIGAHQKEGVGDGVFGGHTGTPECFVSVGDESNVSGTNMVAQACLKLCRFAKILPNKGGCQIVNTELIPPSPAVQSS